MIRGILQPWSGYGRFLEHLGRGLEYLGVPVVFEAGTGRPPGDDQYSDFVRDRLIEGIAPDPWVLLAHAPNGALPIGRNNCVRPFVFLTMWETTEPPTPNRMHWAKTIVTPCRANRDWFQEYFDRHEIVAPPIRVLHPGISANEGFFDFDGGPSELGPCVFGMAGRYNGGGYRKGFSSGIAAFMEAFSGCSPDTVKLSLSISEDDSLDIPNDPRIEVHRRKRFGSDVTPIEDIAHWYRSLTALLVPSKGEAWGMHTHEAMACARPVIAANFGGTADLVSPGCGWELPYDVCPARGNVYDDCGDWCEPTHAGMVNAMRDVYANRHLGRKRGQEAAKRAELFKWSRAAERLKGILVDAGMLRG